MLPSADPHRFSTLGLLVYVFINYFGLFVAVGIGWLVWRTGDAILGYDSDPALEGSALLFGSMRPSRVSSRSRPHGQTSPER